MDIPVLTTERLILAIPGAAAAQRQAAYFSENLAYLAPWNPPFQALTTEVGAAARLDEEVAKARAGTGYRFCIFLKATGVDGPIIGHVSFSNIVRGVFQACTLGYDLAESAQRHGYMTEACRVGIDYAFHEVELHRIMANYMPHNERSAAVLNRLGFTIEGSAKDYLFLAGRWQDHVLTSLVNPSAMAL